MLQVRTWAWLAGVVEDVWGEVAGRQQRVSGNAAPAGALAHCEDICYNFLMIFYGHFGFLISILKVARQLCRGVHQLR